jgi:hypothetical protein
MSTSLVTWAVAPAGFGAGAAAVAQKNRVFPYVFNDLND